MRIQSYHGRSAYARESGSQSTSVVALTFSMPPKKSATVVCAYLAHGYRTPVRVEYTAIMSGVRWNSRRARALSSW